MGDNRSASLSTSLRDLRSRVDTLAKAIFLIAGGAVTLSVNLYLNKRDILCCVVAYLKISWISLLASIVLFSFVIGFMILQGYICGEFYRAKIRNRDFSDAEPARWLDVISLIIGILGFVAFIVGMIYMVVAAAFL